LEFLQVVCFLLSQKFGGFFLHPTCVFIGTNCSKQFAHSFLSRGERMTHLVPHVCQFQSICIMVPHVCKRTNHSRLVVPHICNYPLFANSLCHSHVCACTTIFYFPLLLLTCRYKIFVHAISFDVKAIQLILLQSISTCSYLSGSTL
jgi:hypothetical protein